jgi:glycosyltransferase involved in cell wall biosynthesis
VERTPSTTAVPRIAIACPGIGLVQRGFERFFYDLFRLIEDDFALTLFKGGGTACENEKVLRFTQRNGRLVKLLPVHKMFGRTPYHSECMTFALAMLPHLRNGTFDIVHTIDPPLTRLLYRMRARFGLRFKLLYTEGTAMPPSDYPPADHTQQVAAGPFEDAVAFGHAAETMTLLPCGFHPERFSQPSSRAELRRAHGIDDKTFVILAVGAINRHHKHVDYVIDEVAKLEGNFLLLLDGSLDHGEPDLIDYARLKLGDRCRISHVASEKVKDLYHMADVMVHGATFEAFGLAIVEAAACGLPVIIHDNPHFRWLIANPNCWIEMLHPGALATKLAGLIAEPASRGALQYGEALRRYSWRELKPAYVDLYRHVARLDVRPVPEADCRKAV